MKTKNHETKNPSLNIHTKRNEQIGGNLFFLSRSTTTSNDTLLSDFAQINNLAVLASV